MSTIHDVVEVGTTIGRYVFKGVSAGIATYKAYQISQKEHKASEDHLQIVSHLAYAGFQIIDIPMMATHTYEHIGQSSNTDQSPSPEKICVVTGVKGGLILSDISRIALDPKKNKLDITSTLLSHGTDVVDSVQYIKPDADQEILKEAKVDATAAAYAVDTARLLQKKRKEALQKFKENPLGIKRIIFKNDPILNKYICPITKKPIRFIVKLNILGSTMPANLWYEKKAIETWLEKHSNKIPPGCSPQQISGKFTIIADQPHQEIIDARLKAIASEL